MQAYLALADGSVWRGEALGAARECQGEVVFNTSMTGYQEVLTDPSYCAQIVTMTYPLVGNYGLNEEDMESVRPQVAGFVVRQACSTPSNWRQQERLQEFLARHGLTGIQGVDTRALTRRLRSQGTMGGIIACGTQEPVELADRARAVPPISGRSLVPLVTTPRPYTLPGNGVRVAVLDCGVKHNILRWLNQLGCEVVVFPAATPAAEILSAKPRGVLVSNGPGDPEDVPYAVATVRELLGQVPLFGICLGHQLLGLALGGRTYKLPFGHRGANHPVQDRQTGRVYITSQNHGYALAGDSLPPEVAVSLINLNDGTVEGLVHRELPAFSVQYHPESSPGPTDNEYLFYRFMDMIGGTPAA